MRRAISHAARACRAAGLLLIATLVACSTPARREADVGALSSQAHRERQLEDQSTWSLSGRIAVSDGKDGGSGRIDWRQQGERFVIDIRAPVSRQTWRLTGSPAGARLDGLEGGPRTGPDAQSLLLREVGWQLPVADLVAWARGARGPGAARIEFDPEGRPALIEQRGWTVDYRAWGEGQPALPRKIFAAHGERRVRLVVERWNVGAQSP